MVIPAVKPVQLKAPRKAICRKYLGCLGCLLLPLLIQTLAAKEPEPTLNKGWEEASRLLTNDSYDIFSKIKASSANDQRMIDFSRAATLINVQPKTSSNIAEADRLLQEVVKADSTDEVGISAQYVLGRIAQIHMTPPDEPLAIQRYTDLINAHPQHLLAQAAMTKRAMIRIFALSDEPSLESRYELAVKEAPLVTEPGSRRDYMLILANTAIRLDKPAAVTLDHLLQAEKCNNFRKRALGDLYVRIAEFAVIAGKKEIAIGYYEKFLNDFIRDNRRFIIKEKLASLKSTNPPR